MDCHASECLLGGLGMGWGGVGMPTIKQESVALPL